MRLERECNTYQYLMANSFEDREQIAYYNTHMSRFEMLAEIDRLADCLHALGVRRGDNVALCLPNIPNAIIAFYAANKLGVAVNLVHPLVPQKGLEDIVTRLDSKLVILLDIFYPKYSEGMDRLGRTCIVCSAADYLHGLYRAGYKLFIHNKVKGIQYNDRVIRYSELIAREVAHTDGVTERGEDIGEEIAAYIHSGGTTGEPKTAILSNRAINSCAYNVRWLIGDKVEARTSMLMVLPLFHIFGLGVCMHTALTAGGRCLLVPNFNARSVVKMIRREKPTYMTGVPSMYKKLMAEKGFSGEYLSEMKCCYCGGDKLPQDIKQAFDEIMIANNSPCRLSEGYGLTEAGICTVNAPEIAKMGSVGTPLGDLKVGIFDHNGDRLPVGERGEICISGDNVMSGYYHDEKTTAEVLFRDCDGVLWVRTGDLGYIEESGHLYYVDRLKRMVKVSGINVFPAEIERIVIDNISEIANACAIEIRWQGKSAIKLLVVMQSGSEYSEQIEQRIISVIGERLMKYSLPKVIKCVDSLPMTEIGKVDYKKLTAEENIHEYQ